MNPILVTALTPEETALLVLLRERPYYLAGLETVLSSGMLDQKGATVQVYLDPNGVVTSIEVVRKPLFTRRTGVSKGGQVSLTP